MNAARELPILSRFQSVQRNGNDWRALCPAHPDTRPSLSIGVRDGKVLLHCHAGCSVENVLKAAGVEMRELFAHSGLKTGKVETYSHLGEQYRFAELAPGSKIVKVYDYVDEQGRLLCRICRFEPKDFRPCRPDGKGGWIAGLGNVRRVLYQLPEVLAASEVLVCEGEKDCDTARAMGLVATTNLGGAGKWREEYSAALRGKWVCIIPHADEPGRKHAQQVAESLRGKAQSVKALELPGAKDLTEWVKRGGTPEALLELIRNAAEWKPQPDGGAETPLVALAVEELLAREIKPREMLLDPILPEQGLALLYSWRGVGKTHLALGIAAAVASGGRFLRWAAPRSRKVLYVDGELPGFTLQERLAAILAGTEGADPEPGALKIITPDLQERPMPDLATPEGQRLVEPHLGGVDLLILDNLSALCREGDENKRESWLPVQEWALKLRRKGMSVLFLHHSGKGKQQRGHSTREDLLDIVITLKHPADYNPSEGLRCEVHFEKTRAMLGDAAKPFEVKMETGADGRAIWTLRELEDAKAEQAAELFASGLTVRDVAEELGISKSTAGRLRRKWKAGRASEVSHCPTL